MARVVRRNERHIHVTDHGKRAELRRAEAEEVELMAGVGFVSVGGDRETGQAYIRAYPAPLVSAAVPVRWTKNNPCSFETKSLKPNSKKKKIPNDHQAIRNPPDSFSTFHFSFRRSVSDFIMTKNQEQKNMNKFFIKNKKKKKNVGIYEKLTSSTFQFFTTF